MIIGGLRAIYNEEHERLVKSLDLSKFLYDEEIHVGFDKLFFDWVNNSKNNTLFGLNDFSNMRFTSGSVQTFDHFYIRHSKRTFRFFKDEFMYHNAALKNNMKYEFIDSLNIKMQENEAFVISLPFTRQGRVHDNFYEILDQCEDKNIPVLLDFCHLPVSKNVSINLLKYNCIDTLAFSFSKMFWGAEHLRLGIRLQKFDLDDGIDTFNSVYMFNRISIGIAKEIMKKYAFDYNWDTYGDRYYKFCQDKNLIPCDNVLYAFDNSGSRVVIAGEL